MNEQNYRRISEWFRLNKIRLKIFNLVYKVLTLIIMTAYAGIIIHAIFNMGKWDLARVIFVPMIAFVFCTMLRYVINEARPYEEMNINPLIKKDKKGQSFPSRHALSASVISVCGLYVNITLGVILMVVSLIIAIIRPIAGVHYIKDVTAGFIMGIICGFIGFWVI